jgi:hypothetical protein
MADWSVERVRRRGRDRLRVRTPSGATAGWMCLRTGRIRLAKEFYRSGFQHAVQAWRRHDLASADWRDALGVPPRPRAPLENQDLARIQPGSSAQRQADAARPARGRSRMSRLVGGGHAADGDWSLSALAERRVAGELARLGPGWHVLHAVPAAPGGADIDHIAIGPAGVFVLSTRYHPNARVWIGGHSAMVRGRRVPYVVDAESAARRIARRLTAACAVPVPVYGMVVFVGIASMRSRRLPAGVYVSNGRTVADDLHEMPAVLPPDVVELVYATARLPETWQRRVRALRP